MAKQKVSDGFGLMATFYILFGLVFAVATVLLVDYSFKIAFAKTYTGTITSAQKEAGTVDYTVNVPEEHKTVMVPESCNPRGGAGVSCPSLNRNGEQVRVRILSDGTAAFKNGWLVEGLCALLTAVLTYGCFWGLKYNYRQHEAAKRKALGMPANG